MPVNPPKRIPVGPPETFKPISERIRDFLRTDWEDTPATGLEDPLSVKGLKSALSGLYGDSPEVLGEGPGGPPAGLANVIIPKSPRALEILAKKIPSIFSAGEKWVKHPIGLSESMKHVPRDVSEGVPLNLYRFQQEVPGEPETLRRGGQYFLHKSGEDIPSTMYKGNMPSGTLSSEIAPEGGSKLKEITTKVKNPLIRLVESHYSLKSLIGQSEFDRVFASIKAQPENTLRSIGASTKEIQGVLEHPDKLNAGLDLYKSKVMQRHGYDALIRRRGVGSDTPEVFLPKQTMKELGLEVKAPFEPRVKFGQTRKRFSVNPPNIPGQYSLPD